MRSPLASGIVLSYHMPHSPAGKALGIVPALRCLVVLPLILKPFSTLMSIDSCTANVQACACMVENCYLASQAEGGGHVQAPLTATTAASCGLSAAQLPALRQ